MIKHYFIYNRNRICKMITAMRENAKWIDVEKLIETESYKRGFNHTGR
jgi:dUTPase